ncbi:MAG: lysophospholipase [Anaerolineaceae bacterium]|nr:MAG: lysophospholipase [Anaerolineaceae bacterium]
MLHKEDQFTCTGDTQLVYQCWRPQETTQAALVIVHGFSDHSGRYMNIVKGLVPRGMALYGYDQRGHGRSPGQRGHIDSFNQFRDDLLTFMHLVADQEPDIPLFLMGHSMGGLIVLDFGLHHPQIMRGVIASAPHLSDPPVSPIVATIGRLCSRVWPTFSMDAGLDTSGLSRKAQVVQAYEDDPLVHGKGTARLSTEVATIVAETNANAANFQPPLLIFHGTADSLTNPEASRRFYEEVPSSNKRYISYEGGLHEGHNDIHQERVVIDVAQWIEEQIRIVEEQPENLE